MCAYPAIDMKATGENLRTIMIARGFRVRDLQEFLSLEYPQAIYKWFWGASLPTVDNLLALAKLFQVPMEDLLIETDQEAVFLFLFQHLQVEIFFVPHGNISAAVHIQMVAFVDFSPLRIEGHDTEPSFRIHIDDFSVPVSGSTPRSTPAVNLHPQPDRPYLPFFRHTVPPFTLLPYPICERSIASQPDSVIKPAV